MAADWIPIKRQGHPDVKGEASPRRLLVHVHLSNEPPPEWKDHFTYLYLEVRDPDDEWPLPEFAGTNIVIRPLDDELPSWIEQIDARIKKANDYYENSVILGQEQANDVAREIEEKRRERLEAARRAADGL